ncbi:hypothetical protein EDC01DRAFT_393808 [Geopyxis carbonaria]|nr:hypothetical protein EDC01DRAFT_393808 [Geopyxis carbonaria]
MMQKLADKAHRKIAELTEIAHQSRINNGHSTEIIHNSGQPLKASLSKLRILDLKTHKTRSLRLGERYAAISHVWSTDTNGKGTIIDLVSTCLKESTGLDTQGRPWPTGVWIDTHCIQQTSEEDKAFWVPRMGDVYNSATWVFVMLPGSNAVARLRNYAERLPCKIEFHNCTGRWGSCSEGHPFDSEELDTIRSLYKEVMCAVWRERIWICQETVLAKDLYFFDQSGFTTVDKIKKVCGLLLYANLGDEEIEDSAAWHSKRLMMHNDYNFGTLSANYVITYTTKMKATEQKDLYYGLCGILCLDVKYEAQIQLEDVKKQFYRALLKAGDPSWIISTKLSPRDNTLSPEDDVQIRGRYTHKRIPKVQMELLENGGVLLGKGWSIGSVITLVSIGDIVKSSIGILSLPNTQILSTKCIEDIVHCAFWDWLCLFYHPIGRNNGHPQLKEFEPNMKPSSEASVAYHTKLRRCKEDAANAMWNCVQSSCFIQKLNSNVVGASSGHSPIASCCQLMSRLLENQGDRYLVILSNYLETEKKLKLEYSDILCMRIEDLVEGTHVFRFSGTALCLLANKQAEGQYKYLSAPILWPTGKTMPTESKSGSKKGSVQGYVWSEISSPIVLHI